MAQDWIVWMGKERLSKGNDRMHATNITLLLAPECDRAAKPARCGVEHNPEINKCTGDSLIRPIKPSKCSETSLR